MLSLFQAAEKALKAAQFAVDAISLNTHDLPTVAHQIGDMHLGLLAMKLQALVGDAHKLYNPDPIDFVVIPHQKVTRNTATEATRFAKDILGIVRRFLEMAERSYY